jgi:hypothetical protein
MQLSFHASLLNQLFSHCRASRHQEGGAQAQGF